MNTAGFNPGLASHPLKRWNSVSSIPDSPVVSVDRSMSASPKSVLQSRPENWVLIVNGLKLKQWQEISYRLVKQLRNVKYKIYITEKPGHAALFAEQAAKTADLIVSIGGDGTLNEVIDGVMHSGVVDDDGVARPIITALPLGVNSNFFRSMCWDPEDVESAMWRIGHGSLATLDVARIRCDSPHGLIIRHYLNVASCGAPALGMMKREKWKWLGQNLGNKVASCFGFMKYARQPLSMRLDDGQWMKLPNASLIAVGNGSHFSTGLKIAPGADPYDGQLQVVTGVKMGGLGFMTKKGKMFWGTHLDLDNFDTHNCTKVDVSTYDSVKRHSTALRHVLESSVAMEEFTVATPRTPSGTRMLPPVLEVDGEGDSPIAAVVDGAEPEVVPETPKTPTSKRSLSRKKTSAALQNWRKMHHARGLVTADKEWLAAPDIVPVEVDGEVIGQAPFGIQVLPGRIKMMI